MLNRFWLCEPSISLSALQGGEGGAQRVSAGRVRWVSATALESPTSPRPSPPQGAERENFPQAIASVTAPQATRTTPVARPIQPPQGRVFSISTSSAIAAIQARFMIPPTNSSAISTQQQPRQ